jgi:hypothetical protein
MQRRHGPALALLLLAGALFAAPAPRVLAAEDDPLVPPNDPGYQFYEKAASRILRTAGDKVWDAAKDAIRAGFFQFGVEQAERAIQYDPDQKDAREFLKYVKKDEKWVRDEAAWNDPNVKKNNQKSASSSGTESEESFQKRIQKWEDESLAPANKFVASKYADLGDECFAKGHPHQAKKGWESALRFDKENAKARKGLGFKKFGKVWLTEKQDQARKDAAKGEELKVESEWDGLFGAKLNKVASSHFRIESPYPVPELMDYLTACETAYAYYLADFGRDPTDDAFEGGTATFVVMQDDAQWNLFVDRYGGEDKEFTRQCSGTGDGMLLRGIRSGAGSTPMQRKDQIVHGSVHMLNRYVWGLESSRHAWADEGLCYYYSLKVLDSVATFCVALKKGNYAKPGNEGGMKEWLNAANWKSKIKDLVRAKSDVPMRTLILQPLTQLEFDATVKAWCVCTWFMDTDRDKWIETLSQLRDSAKGEPVLQGLWGKGLEELDDDWHRWVIKTY